jgi:hypothetical protein
MRAQVPALLLSLLAVSACGGGDADERSTASTSPATTSPSEPPGTTTAPEPSPPDVALVATPADALAACRSSRLLRGACPRLVPEAPYGRRPEVYVVELRPAGRGAPETFNLQWGAEDPARPERNRPPRLSHLVVATGRAGTTLRGVETRVLRRASWQGRRGTLLLAAPYPRGGLMGDHLIFRWRDGRREYAASLHAWEPFQETVDTLEAIVASMPRP